MPSIFSCASQFPKAEAAPKGLAVMETPEWQDESLLADPVAAGHGY